MRKPLFVVFMYAALVLAFSLPSLWAVDAPKGDFVVKMEGGTPTKPPVKFPHEKHKAMDCKACHHKLDANAKDYKCSSKGCHDSTDPTDKTSPKSFYMAFHKGDSAHSCMSCHKKAKAEGKNAPISCNQCHQQ